MLFLCSPMERLLLISLVLLLAAVGLDTCRFYLKYINDENDIDIKELRNQISHIQIYIALILVVIICLYSSFIMDTRIWTIF